MPTPYADMECTLQVNPKCAACMHKSLEVVRSIVGVFSVDIDAKRHLMTVTGEVDPNIVLRALLDAGYEHAELVHVKFKHPRLRNRNYNSYSSSYGGGYVPSRRDGYNYGSYGGGYNLLHEQPYSYGMQRIAAPQIGYHPSYNNSLAFRSPSYSYQERDLYGNYHDGMNGCSIM